MDTEQDKKTPPHIHEQSDGERQYILHPEDNDLFVQTGRQVIAGCRLGISINVWLSEVTSMFDYLRAWIREKVVDRIMACYAVPRGATTYLFFIPRDDAFDFELADLLARLNVELITKYNVGQVEIHQMPESELDRFVVPGMSVEIYSARGRSRQPVAP